MKPLVQISLDLTNIDEALDTASMALRAGVDWLDPALAKKSMSLMAEKVNPHL